MATNKQAKYDRQWQRTYNNKVRRIEREKKKQANAGHVYKYNQPKLK